MFSFDSPESPGGLYVNLSTFRGAARTAAEPLSASKCSQVPVTHCPACLVPSTRVWRGLHCSRSQTHRRARLTVSGCLLPLALSHRPVPATSPHAPCPLLLKQARPCTSTRSGPACPSPRLRSPWASPPRWPLASMCIRQSLPSILRRTHPLTRTRLFTDCGVVPSCRFALPPLCCRAALLTMCPPLCQINQGGFAVNEKNYDIQKEHALVLMPGGCGLGRGL